MLDLARGGLERRGFRDAAGRDEALYLAPLEAIVNRGRTQAELLLDRYHGVWGGSVDPVFTECVY